MPAIIILVVLLTGFLFTSRYPLARFKQLRSSGWAFYLHAFAWGSLFSSVAAICTLWIDSSNPTASVSSYPILSSLGGLKTQIGYDLWLGVKLWTWGLISVTLAWGSGTITSKFASVRQQAGLRVAKENEFEMLLYTATKDINLVQVTLLSRKVYIGFVLKTVSVEDLSKTEYFSIIPVFSGYRKDNTLALEITTDYLKFYETSGLLTPPDDEEGWDPIVHLERFKVVAPSREVASISFFDADAHEGVVKASTADLNKPSKKAKYR